MGRQWLTWHGAVLIAAVMMTSVARIPASARAQGTDDLAVLNDQVVKPHRAGKYAEATGLAK
jgi:hypothetical protein